MSSQSIIGLFAQTLVGDYDHEDSWNAVRELRTIGTREVFDQAAAWCNSENPLARARGAAVLAQLGKTPEHPRNTFPEESYSVILALVQRETEPLPLASAIAALGHLDNPAAVPLIAGFGSHPSPDVRFDVVFALGCFPNDPLSVTTMMQLMEDPDSDVRDWATFGVGTQSDADSPEIRDALVRRLTDTDQDTREEAMVGLAKRKDERVLPTLLLALTPDFPSTLEMEAADWMLDLLESPGWTGPQYTAALRERFSA